MENILNPLHVAYMANALLLCIPLLTLAAIWRLWRSDLDWHASVLWALIILLVPLFGPLAVLALIPGSRRLHDSSQGHRGNP